MSFDQEHESRDLVAPWSSPKAMIDQRGLVKGGALSERKDSSLFQKRVESEDAVEWYSVGGI